MNQEQEMILEALVDKCKDIPVNEWHKSESEKDSTWAPLYGRVNKLTRKFVRYTSSLDSFQVILERVNEKLVSTTLCSSDTNRSTKYHVFVNAQGVEVVGFKGKMVTDLYTTVEQSFNEYQNDRKERLKECLGVK